jgi:hypothetical protein
MVYAISSFGHGLIKLEKYKQKSGEINALKTCFKEIFRKFKYNLKGKF